MPLIRSHWTRPFRKYGARWSLGLLLTALALAQVSGAVRIDAIERMDTFFADLRMRLVKPVLDPRIVIVDIDEKSIAEIGHFPWNRKVVARLVSQLTGHYGVAAAGFDIVFSEADNTSGYDVLDSLASHEMKDVGGFRARVEAMKQQLDYDGLLAAALEDQPVVLGYNVAQDQRKGELPAPFFKVDDLNGRELPAVTYSGYLGNLERLQSAAATGGIFTALPDPDGILRHTPLLMRIGDGYYPTLSLATAAVALQARAIVPRWDTNVADMSARERANGALDTLLMFVGQQKMGMPIQVGENLTNLIEFRGTGGPAGGAFPYVSAADVLAGRVKKEALADRIVLIGTTAPGLLDLRATPVNSAYPGVEVHANMIKSILDHSFKVRPDYADGIEGLQVVLAGGVLALALAVLSPLPSILLAAALAAAVFGFNYWSYTGMDWVLKMAMTLVLIAAVFVLNVAWGYFFEVRRNRGLVSRFGEYVAPELVAQMAENPEQYNMDGESRELTVMFVDVRGFTTISEGLTPKQLREYINLYLTAMSEDIRSAHQGTLDKYIGDAVMAFWGAPVAFSDHASRGVATSLLMQASAQRLNQDFLARGWPELKIGIGLNSGLMHVGDMGSNIRRAYTVMGDAVNLGSRLEGITKVYGVGIAVGEATRAAAPEFTYRELDLVRVKGKNEPVAIFEPLALARDTDQATLDEVARWHAALAAVRAQRWDEADAMLAELRALAPQRGLYQLYVGRIAHYRAHPPGDQWDGVTTFETK
ncbi:CHASE2 domain-containing protein [Duganella callida]|uniref:Adenylate/guanylate cyclase domain-containing protein n=1 Tax=Duganella callida TaxID=2561932 RepID=A0A4Y9S9D0_9BURK|nr:adenylate/guanylate cyclase domain-containing protein [Duganella callida]TFW18349.1 adenylate/guanylate cyclase domain-containing protein [Duganella callida]